MGTSISSESPATSIASPTLSARGPGSSSAKPPRRSSLHRTNSESGNVHSSGSRSVEARARAAHHKMMTVTKTRSSRSTMHSPANGTPHLERSTSTASSLDSVSAVGGPTAAGGTKFCDILPFDRDADDDRLQLVCTLVHTADLSGHAYVSTVSRNWNARILSEFRAQATKERAQGLPVAPFMANLDTPLQCARLQLSFVSNIVLPLWRSVSELLPGLAEPLANLNSVRLGFEAETMRYERQAEAAAAAANATRALTPPSTALHISVSKPALPPAPEPAAPAPAPAPAPVPVAVAPTTPLMPTAFYPSSLAQQRSIDADAVLPSPSNRAAHA
ncbi:hypothetical protein EON67_05690 [archaeon]|nr:MAG: hypothetical protein EON67_05690 [archaeon]